MTGAFDDIIIRQMMPGESSGSRPKFTPIRLGKEGVEEQIEFKSPLYLGKMPDQPSTHKQRELADYALNKETYYPAGENLGLPGCFALWTPSRTHVTPKLLRKSRGIEVWTSEAFYERDMPVVYDHVEKGGLTPHIELLREATEYKLPITVRLSGGDIYKQVVSAVEAGADGVTISIHDTMVTPHKRGMLGLFPPAARAMFDSGGRKDGVVLMVEGDIGSGEDLYKCLAMGADMVGVTTPAMEMLELGRGKLDEFFSLVEQECLALMGLSGQENQETLSSDNLMAADYDTAVVTGLKMLGYEKELPIWLH